MYTTPYIIPSVFLIKHTPVNSNTTITIIPAITIIMKQMYTLLHTILAAYDQM